MAGPHVAGTVALLWSAAPYLIGDVDGTEWVIAQTARPRTTTQGCGDDDPDDVPNNVYGWGIVDALAAVLGETSGLKITKQAHLAPLLPGAQLTYTIRVTNTAIFTLTQVVLTDTIPVSATFAWANGNYTLAGGVVTWTAASLAPDEVLTATLAVTVEHLSPGTPVVNVAYGVRVSELLTPVMGAPVEVVIPWQYILSPIFRNWSLGGSGGG